MGLFDTNFTEKEKMDAIASDTPSHSAQFGKTAAIPKAISERHVACVFLLDVSGSMNRENAIDKLNEGMLRFQEHMLQDKRIADVVDAAVVTFGSTVQIVQNFLPVSEMKIPALIANGQTPLGEALKTSLDLISKRKDIYKSTGTPYFRPWIFCITDGIPTDDWQDAAKSLKEAEDNNKVIARCVCVENDPNFSKNEIHQIFNPSRILKLENLDFSGLFEFVSNSLAAVSQSNPGDKTINVEVPHTLTMDI